jgi:membrane protease YdiL (CAAX protease family)
MLLTTLTIPSRLITQYLRNERLSVQANTRMTAEYLARRMRGAMSTQVQEAPLTETPQPTAIVCDRKTRVLDAAVVLLVALWYPFYGCVLYAIYGDVSFSFRNAAAMRYSHMILYETVSLLVLAWVLRRQGRPFGDIGLKISFAEVLRSFPLFVVTYIALFVFSIVVQAAALAVTGHYAKPHVPNLFEGGALIGGILVVFVNPWFEELIVRAFLMTELKALTGKAWVAVAVSTLVQAAYHLYQGWLGALSVGTVFLVFSFYFAKKQRILPVILAHCFSDAIALMHYYRP